MQTKQAAKSNKVLVGGGGQSRSKIFRAFGPEDFNEELKKSFYYSAMINNNSNSSN